MKNLNLIHLPLFCLILFSCHTKPKPEPKRAAVEYNMPNYKFDDDELARRKTEAARIDKPIKKTLKKNMTIRKVH